MVRRSLTCMGARKCLSRSDATVVNDRDRTLTHDRVGTVTGLQDATSKGALEDLLEVSFVLLNDTAVKGGQGQLGICKPSVGRKFVYLRNPRLLRSLVSSADPRPAVRAGRKRQVRTLRRVANPAFWLWTLVYRDRTLFHRTGARFQSLQLKAVNDFEPVLSRPEAGSPGTTGEVAFRDRRNLTEDWQGSRGF